MANNQKERTGIIGRIAVSFIGIAIILWSVNHVCLFYFGKTTKAVVTTGRISTAADSNEPTDQQYKWSVAWTFYVEGEEYSGMATVRGSAINVKHGNTVHYYPFLPQINSLYAKDGVTVWTIITIALGVLLIIAVNKKQSSSKSSVRKTIKQLEDDIAEQKQPLKRSKNIKSRTSISSRILILAIVCAVIVIAGFYILPKIRKPKSTNYSSDTVSVNVSSDSPVVSLSDITVDVNALNLDGGSEKLTVSRMAISTHEDSKLKSVEYDISLGEMHRLKAPLTLTIPYDKKLADGGEVVLVHYDSDYGIWIPLETVDNGDYTVSASLNSLSPIRMVFLGKDYLSSLFYISDMSTANAQMKVNMNWWNIINKQPLDTASAVVNGFLSSGSTDVSTSWLNDAANEVNTINTYYTLFGAAGDAAASLLGEAAGASSAIGVTAADVSKGIGAASLIIAGVQLAYDAANSDAAPNTASVNLLKNLSTNGGTLFGLATGGGTAALSVGYFGVAVFGYGLDIAVEYAKDIQEDTIKAICDQYYKEFDSFDEQDWYTLFVDAYLDAWQNGKGSQNGANEAIDKVKAAIDAYAEKFWNDIYKDGNDTLTFSIAEAGRTNYFTPTAHQKQSIILGMKKDMYERFEYNVIPWIKDYMKNEMQTALYCSLLDICAPYNEKYTIQIQEVAPQESGDPCEFQDCVIRFAADGDFVTPDIKDTWRLQSPKDDDEWTVTSEFTLMAYLVADMPDAVYIYKKDSDFSNRKNFDEMRSVVLEDPKQTRLTVIDLSREGSYSNMPLLYNVTSVSYAFADGEYPDDLIDIAETLAELIEYAFIKAGRLDVDTKGSTVTFTLPSYTQKYTYSPDRVYHYQMNGLTFVGKMNSDMTEGTFTVTGGDGSYIKDSYNKWTRTFTDLKVTAKLSSGDEENWGLDLMLSYTMYNSYTGENKYIKEQPCFVYLDLVRK